jgi:putative Mn2+ efflux pump MntP
LEYYLEITAYLLQALALAMVPFSVALYSSAYRCIEINESFEIGIFFSFFQGGLLLLGWLTGYALAGYFSSLAFPVASMIFLFIGIKLFSESRKPVPEKRTYPARNFRLLTGFSVAISINAFLVGIGNGLVESNWMIMTVSLVFMTYFFSLLGVRIGKKGRFNTARNSEIAGGVIMLAMSAFMIVQYIKMA